ncbi:PepSY domain-containing protein [Sphingomonas yunnanensis]|uniref:PepSY-associated TM helix domain-containing protein n=1 Tax=Sphingomonas yunnanensis TaxID=310400 RepID=UPI001CA6A054|nr:PepSY domain-containing protein [Sphingomonas yunnanensis]MBY9064307.1 PepSY domain-containing protein [Sphingomonas yunnanensis]
MADLYRAVWRWHFFAGLLTLPFLLWLAVTGSLYLYKPELERVVYGDWLRAAAPGAPLPAGTLAARVERQTGGRVVQLLRPAGDDEAWRITYALPDGASRMAFVDPGNGQIAGTTTPGGMMQTVKKLHSLALTGWVGNWLIEIAAGWSIVLVLSGLYLWWRRGRAPAIGVRGPPVKRLFWRDLHASTGLVAGAVILFLSLSGLPWSAVWGRNVQAAVAGAGWGRPPAPVAPALEHAQHDLPWSLQQRPMPHGRSMHGSAAITADQALAVAARRGVARDYALSWPAAPGAPWLVSANLGPAQAAHVIYVDAADARVLQDARFGDFGGAARVIEWSAAVHQGKQYGEPNRLVMLAACVALALLCVSAPVMWWKRRPRGRVGAPPGQSGAGLVTIMGVAGLLFPLTGLTMVAALAGQAAWRWGGRRRGRALVAAE